MVHLKYNYPRYFCIYYSILIYNNRLKELYVCLKIHKNK